MRGGPGIIEPAALTAVGSLSALTRSLLASLILQWFDSARVDPPLPKAAGCTIISGAFVRGGVAQSGRASGSYPLRHWFKSSHRHQDLPPFGPGSKRGLSLPAKDDIITPGPLAQLVEQLTLNQRAQGSSPWWSTSSDKGLRDRPQAFFVFGRPSKPRGTAAEGSRAR